MGNKLGLTQQPSAVSPNAEDLSLILGSMARGRSFSTTTNPKPAEINISHSMPKDRSPGSHMESNAVLRRKKSVPHTQKEKYIWFEISCHFESKICKIFQRFV